MKNSVKAMISFAATVVMALIGCVFDANITFSTAFMMGSLVCGAAFVYYVNKEVTPVRENYTETAARGQAKRSGKAA